MREIPHSPVALYEAAHLFGTLIAETILASVHVRAHPQAGHMDASDLIKALQNTLRGGGRPHMDPGLCGRAGEADPPAPAHEQRLVAGRRDLCEGQGPLCVKNVSEDTVLCLRWR